MPRSHAKPNPSAAHKRNCVMPATMIGFPAPRSFLRSISRPMMKSSKMRPISEMISIASRLRTQAKPSSGPITTPASRYASSSGCFSVLAMKAKTVATVKARPMLARRSGGSMIIARRSFPPRGSPAALSPRAAAEDRRRRRLEQSRVLVRKTVELDARDFLTDEVFDRGDLLHVLGDHDGEGVAGGESAPGSSDAVYVVFGMMRDVEVDDMRSEEHTSELQSHSFISYAVFCLKKN